MAKRKTAGELALKAASDPTKYDSLEVGHALTEAIAKELMVCAHRHRHIFDEEEYCVGYVIAGDPMIKNVMRRKFFAMLYLPSPRPNQAVFLYNKVKDQFTKRLWVLPNAATMAELSEMPWVDKPYRMMKAWCDAFYEFRFWEFIRKQHNINMLSESEYLKANREKLIKAGCQETKAPISEPFDFSKVTINKIADTKTAVRDEDILDHFGQTKSLNWDISSHEL
jgi:hypothetical protein